MILISIRIRGIFSSVRRYLHTMNCFEVRDINYPRAWASSLNFDNQFIYCFGGYNPFYEKQYIEKIEKYLVGANDWIAIKFSI